jgi:hypothetical protein
MAQNLSQPALLPSRLWICDTPFGCLESLAYMFGDNQSVLTSSNIPHSSLNKRRNALSYHCVREAVTSDILCWFFYVKSTENPAKFLWPFSFLAPHQAILILAW